jgi:hypothetical protein
MPAPQPIPPCRGRAGHRAADGGARRLTRALAAIRILSAISREASFRPWLIPSFGLVTKSTAPNSNALRVTSAPRSVSVDTITTGIGRSRMIFSRKSSPSILGISTSSVSTSGSRLRIISRAWWRSLAAPIASMSGCALIIELRRLRTNAESSTTSTLIFAISCALPSSEQFDFAAALLVAPDLLQIATLLRGHTRLALDRQLLDHGLARLREQADLARKHVQHVARDDRDPLRGKELFDEGDVLGADVDAR